MREGKTEVVEEPQTYRPLEAASRFSEIFRRLRSKANIQKHQYKQEYIVSKPTKEPRSSFLHGGRGAEIVARSRPRATGIRHGHEATTDKPAYDSRTTRMGHGDGTDLHLSARARSKRARHTDCATDCPRTRHDRKPHYGGTGEATRTEITTLRDRPVPL